ncbi:UNVERIFIED_CONTAM: hypothetical protein FKN15_008943 [Acipenser sinensis]
MTGIAWLYKMLTDRPPPIIRQGPANQTLAVDSLALLKCQALGDPIPTISWLKDGLSLLGKDSRMSLQDRGSLQIKNIRMDRQSQFIQGYRVMYRQTSGLSSPSSWQSTDVKVPTERSTVLSSLKKGIVYEIKVRPYFNEFQGMDSDSKTARTTEEAPSAPPQSVTVLTVGNHNSTSISVSWDPPPPDHQNGIIQEYKIWCLANETRFDINKTVDAAIRSVVIGGLYSGIQYRVAVAASTSAGVGVKSEPHPIIIGNFKDVIMSGAGSNNSITEQITDVVKQPAFIAGIGGACWVILMGFSIWLYWRRKKRKGLSNYADALPLVPSQGDKSGTMLSDGAIYSSIDFTTKASYNSPSQIPQATPYATTQILHSNSIHELAVDLPDPQWKASIQAKQDLTGLGYSLPDKTSCNNNALPLVPSQGDKSGTMLSDGAIYSSIDFTTKASYNSPSQIPQATPYATTQILHSNSIHELAVDLPDPQWKASIQAKQDLTGLGYSLPDKTSCNNSGKGGKKKKNKSGSKPHKTNGSNWVNVPLPPPPVHPLPGTELDHYGGDHQEGGYGNDGWGPPLPVQTYLHQGMGDELEEEDERVPTPPIRGVASSPAMSYGQQSTATLTPSPREEIQPMLQAHLDELTRAYQFDIAKQTWHMQGNPHPPQAPAPPLGYISSTLVSDLETDIPDEEDEDEEEDEGYEIARPLRGIEHTPASSMDNLDSSVTGKCYSSSQRPRPGSPFSTDSNTSAAHSQNQKARPTKKHKGGRLDQAPMPHRREGIADGECVDTN